MPDETCGHELTDGGTCSFAAKYPDGHCGHHTDESDTKQGRDSKLTKQRQEEIAQAIENGKSMNSAARMAGVTPQTVHNWIDRGDAEETGIYADFFERIAHAKGYGEDFYFNLALEIAKENADHRFIASLMKQRYPDSWGETDTGVEADNITVEIPENVASTWPTRD